MQAFKSGTMTGAQIERLKPGSALRTEFERLAEVELSYGDPVYATVPLVSVAGVEASRSPVVQKQIREFLSQTSVRIAIAAVVVLILILVVWKMTMGRRRYRYGKSVGRQRNYRGRRRRF